MDDGRQAQRPARRCPVLASAPAARLAASVIHCLHARHLRRRLKNVGTREAPQRYISMLPRISPTANPSISNGSPGLTTMVG